MKRDEKDSTREGPRHLQGRQMVTQGYHAKSTNQGKNQKGENKNEDELEKFTKKKPIPCDELSTSWGNSNNAESKRNLQNLLGSYYSSDEESEEASQQREDLTQGGAPRQRGKHQGDTQSDSEAEEEDNTDNDNHSDDIPDDEGEALQGKKQTQQSRGHHGKIPKEKEEEQPTSPLRSNPEGEKTKMNYQEEEPASQHQNDKKKRRTSPSPQNKCQRKSESSSQNKSSHMVGKIDYNIKNSQSSLHRGYNARPSWGDNPTQENCQQPPWDRKSSFQNFNSGLGRQYPYDGSGQYVYNCGVPTDPKGSLNKLSLTNFGFSTKKEINVDLENIPVIDQRQILSDWKPTMPEEKNRSQKYNIKTKVYNAASNTFDKVIIHGNKQKRKHQINWLAKEAVEKEYEILQKTNYSKRRTTNDKYGW
ncbi:hypothetical protein C922_02008 [Plasmodium inui San Antonio 1]|uniref:Uncharacterized protein n=1 Tax=Plasmodium inui San Antonio 1 TaxID=1237626 RepID=W7AFJ1_9APIC|nr:hypothetical protein C922_02008 [Plasmodium inui San Antonio 1]EUD67819.1 hypothetical protein C922_02008 [Plasmodium inui San Antonio 1]